MEHTYLEIRPSPRLSPYVECYWTRGAAEDDLDHRVLPDGCADILFSRQRDEPAGLWVIGTMSQYRAVPIAAGQSFLGVRFRPAMAAGFLSEPLRAIGAAQKAIDDMVHRKGVVSIDEPANGAGLSARQFRRQCLALTGLTPKRLCRVIRFRPAVSTPCDRFFQYSPKV
jgi:AraC-like DNA-binding protein